MKKKIASILFFLPFFSGCFSSTGDTVGDDVSDNGMPFTEAFLEYPGPHERWAGPQNFILHVQTKNPGNPRLTLTPQLQGGQIGRQGIALGLSTEAVREELARLKTALQQKDQPYYGCLSPVRVKLIRLDGVLVERQGCRGQEGWPRVASEVVSHFLESSLSIKQRAPAHKKK